LGKENKDKDYAFVIKSSEELLVELCDVLNEYHKTDHSLRYWRIVLGHWLIRYTSLIFNRWFTLNKAIHDYEISGTTIFDTTSYSLATPDSTSFLLACDDDVWNHVIYAKILSHLDKISLETEVKSFGGMSGFKVKSESVISKVQQFKNFAIKTVFGIFRILSRDNDGFITTTYLPKMEEMKLQIILGQLPQIWRVPTLETIKPDRALRKRLSINASNHQGFDQFVRIMLMEILPTSYLEGYQTLNQEVQALPWPENPRFIFTCNSFDTDEIFKVWTGLKVEQGVPYIIGQHGNNYGTSRYCMSETECVATCDKFTTWGWTDGNSKHTPAFIFKTVGKKRLKINENGGLLLITVTGPHRIHPWDSYLEFEKYLDEQYQFVSTLAQSIHEKLTVRLHFAYKKFSFFEEMRWRDISPATRLELGNESLGKLIARSRLVVYSYDSTGILETLTMNIPTMCFWHGGLDHLRPEAKPFYELLRSAGILLDTPEAAAEKVTAVWNDVPGWWKSQKVQEARERFCNRYARFEKNPLRTLKSILLVNS
jgi:putative transferase (TIGR04331 family)